MGFVTKENKKKKPASWEGVNQIKDIMNKLRWCEKKCQSLSRYRHLGGEDPTYMKKIALKIRVTYQLINQKYRP